MLAALSLAADAANGLPSETSIRTCVLVRRVASVAGVSASYADAAWQAALLRFLGCTAFAHEEMQAFGADDVEVRRAFNPVDYSRPRDVLPAAWNALGAGPGSRPLRMATLLARSATTRYRLAESACDVGRRLSARLGMPAAVGVALEQLHERWDSAGEPRRIGEEDLSVPTRLLHLACVAEAHHRMHGPQGAEAELRRRAGGHLEPRLVQVVLQQREHVLGPLGESSSWDEALAGAPSTTAAVPVSELCRVFGDFIDLKTPHGLGHSREVARLCARAATVAGLPDDRRLDLCNAAWVHNLGHVSVGNHIWERPGTLSSSEWEQVRLHPYRGARALARSSVLAPLQPLVASHHERCDGSGYPHGTTLPNLPFGARLLAIADAYVAMLQPRPHRPERSAPQAIAILEAERDAGRLDGHALACVLEALGQAGKKPRGHSELSPREIEVLVHVARGESNKAIGRALEISAKTVQHHVRSVYQKAGVRSRAAAALWAIERGFFEL